MKFLANETINNLVQEMEREEYDEKQAAETFMQVMLLAGRNIMLLNGDKEASLQYIHANLEHLQSRVLDKAQTSAKDSTAPSH